MKKGKYYTKLLVKASQIQGTLAGVIRCVLIWDNITEDQKSRLNQILSDVEKINLLED